LEEQGKKKGTGAGKTRREPMDPTRSNAGVVVPPPETGSLGYQGSEDVLFRVMAMMEAMSLRLEKLETSSSTASSSSSPSSSSSSASFSHSTYLPSFSSPVSVPPFAMPSDEVKPIGASAVPIAPISALESIPGETVKTLHVAGLYFSIPFGTKQIKDPSNEKKFHFAELQFSGSEPERFSRLMQVLWEWSTRVKGWGYCEEAAWTLLRSNLTGSARSCAWACPNWRDGVKMLLLAYATPAEKERVRKSISRMRRRPTETGFEFVMAIWRRAQPFFGKEIMDDDLWRYFLDGLDSNWITSNATMHVLLALDQRTRQPFSKAVELLQSHSETRPYTRRRHQQDGPRLPPASFAMAATTPSSSSSTASSSPPMSAPTTSTARQIPQKKCFLCGKTGHLKRDCQQNKVNSVEGGKKAHIVVKLTNGLDLEAEIDSGSSFHLISERFLTENGLSFKKKRFSLQAANSTPLAVIGETKLEDSGEIKLFLLILMFAEISDAHSFHFNFWDSLGGIAG
jgi:hypothetical protein